MTGKFEIEVYNNRIHYFLTVKRNITILQGDSATGKSELIRLVTEYEENGNSSGITLKCDAKCTVLTSVDWELRLNALRGNIIFIDETANFVKSQRFAEMVRGSDNYFVMVTRDDLEQLPYSIEEIYGLRSDTSKYKPMKRVYNEMYKLYNLPIVAPIATKVIPEIVITEDSNSGFQCFSLIFTNCKSAGGKSNIYRMIRSAEEAEQMLVIVDGAAFGPEMGKIARYLRASNKKCVIYAPESFEYIVLSSGLIDVPASVLDETYMHADSIKYMSWEEFYTEYLIQATRETIYRYNKSSLANAYKTSGTLKRIVQTLPEQIRPSLLEDDIQDHNL